MASKRHPHAPRLVQWLRLLVLAALVVHFGQCWAPTSSLLRVQPRRRRDGSSSSRTSCSSVETISKFNRVVLSAETEDVEESGACRQRFGRVSRPPRTAWRRRRTWRCPRASCRTPGGAPAADELTNENMLRIILSMCTDAEVNELVWKCLGYRRKDGEGEWDASECFPKWKERFPTPPDLIGVTRIYSKEIDGPSLKANQALVRTVPMKYKQSIREHVRVPFTLVCLSRPRSIPVHLSVGRRTHTPFFFFFSHQQQIMKYKMNTAPARGVQRVQARRVDAEQDAAGAVRELAALLPRGALRRVARGAAAPQGRGRRGRELQAPHGGKVRQARWARRPEEVTASNGGDVLMKDYYWWTISRVPQRVACAV